MRLKQASLFLYVLSSVLILIGAYLRVQYGQTSHLSTYLLGGGIATLLAAGIGLYLAREQQPLKGSPEDDRVELPELEKRPQKNEDLV